jgi:protease I
VSSNPTAAPPALVIEDALPGDYDALLLPGGVMSPDKLRMNQTAVRFVRQMFDDGKPVDRGIVSSRKLDDIPAFNQKMIEEFKEGRHGGAGTRERAETARAHN